MSPGVGEDDHPKLRKVVRASQRVKDPEERLQAAREAFYAAMHEAREAGVSTSAVLVTGPCVWSSWCEGPASARPPRRGGFRVRRM
jgi:hypothetical protein